MLNVEFDVMLNVEPLPPPVVVHVCTAMYSLFMSM